MLSDIRARRTSWQKKYRNAACCGFFRKVILASERNYNLRQVRLIEIMLDTACDSDDVIDARRRKHRTQNHEQQQNDIHGFLAVQILFQYSEKHNAFLRNCFLCALIIQQKF